MSHRSGCGYGFDCVSSLPCVEEDTQPNRPATRVPSSLGFSGNIMTKGGPRCFYVACSSFFVHIAPSVMITLTFAHDSIRLCMCSPLCWVSPNKVVTVVHLFQLCAFTLARPEILLRFARCSHS